MSEENENIKEIKFPVELQQLVMGTTEVCGRHLTIREIGNSTHYLAKPMALYLFLKAESPEASLIQNYTKQIPLLCKYLGWSKRTFDTHLKTLVKMDLVTKDKGHLRIARWTHLGNVLGINTKNKIKIKFNCNGKQKIHLWFAALEIKGNQELQADMVWKKAHKNSNIESVLREALIKRDFDLNRENDPDYYASCLLRLMIEDFRIGTEVHDILISIRSDVNRSSKLIAKSWAMSMPLVCYWKKQMIQQEIIFQDKIEIMSEWERDRQDCGKNKFCRVVWDDKEKQRVWRLCKQIRVMMPCESLEEWLKKIEKKMAA